MARTMKVSQALGLTSVTSWTWKLGAPEYWLGKCPHWNGLMGTPWGSKTCIIKRGNRQNKFMKNTCYNKAVKYSEFYD